MKINRDGGRPVSAAIRRQLSLPRLSCLLGVALLGLLATSASAAVPPTVYLDQAGLSEGVRPAAFAVADYNDPHDPNTLANSRIITAIWSSWGGAKAEGSGQALIQWTDATTGLHAQARATVPVVVSATGLHSCGGVSVYTSLVITPTAGASVPPHFAQVQQDGNVMPCAVHGGSYVAGQDERRDPNGCFFNGLRELIIQPPFSVFYCAMRWKGWGANSTIGLGVARIGFKQYGLRVKLSRIRWCRQWTVSYTRETAEIWGAGEEPQRTMGNVSPSEAAKLRALIGRHGQPHKTLHEAMPSGAGCG